MRTARRWICLVQRGFSRLDERARQSWTTSNECRRRITGCPWPGRTLAMDVRRVSWRRRRDARVCSFYEPISAGHNSREKGTSQRYLRMNFPNRALISNNLYIHRLDNLLRTIPLDASLSNKYARGYTFASDLWSTVGTNNNYEVELEKTLDTTFVMIFVSVHWLLINLENNRVGTVTLEIYYYWVFL